MDKKKTYSSFQVAKLAGIHAHTLYRWLKDKKFPEPIRNRINRREFSEEECARIVEYANKKLPPREL